MSGVAIIAYLLEHDADLIALVPAARIISGVVPLPTVRPAIRVSQVSGNQLNTLKMAESSYLVTERVQVTAFAEDEQGVSGYAKVKLILAEVLKSLPSTRGTVNGFTSESIHPDIEGPDFYNEQTGIYSQSQDFNVMYKRAY